jgi:hypothetical protein
MRKRKYKSKDISPVDWYIASYIHRFIVIGEDNEDLKKRFLAWKNTIIIKAKSPDEAYKKAIKIGKQGCKPYTNTDGERVRFVFEGLTTLLPIYEDLEDGAEILWAEHKNRSLKKIRRWIKSKKELEVFEDYIT